MIANKTVAAFVQTQIDLAFLSDFKSIHSGIRLSLPYPLQFSSLVSSRQTHSQIYQSCDNTLDILQANDYFSVGKHHCRVI